MKIELYQRPATCDNAVVFAVLSATEEPTRFFNAACTWSKFAFFVADPDAYHSIL